MCRNAKENSTRRVWRNDGPICTCSTCSVESNRDSEWMSVSEYPNNCVKQRPSYKANLVIRWFRFQKAGSSIIEKKECISWSKLIADSRRWVSKFLWNRTKMVCVLIVPDSSSKIAPTTEQLDQIQRKEPQILWGAASAALLFQDAAEKT